MATVTVNGGQPVHFVDYGGDGPPVVLLHSFLMDIDMWEPQVEAFGAEYRLIAIDERGQGGTPADADFDYWDVARDVVGVMDHLGVERAAVVGTSQGGFIGLRMALLAPERVTSLAVLGTSAEPEAEGTAAVYRQLIGAWLQTGPEPLVDGVATFCLGDYEASSWKAKWRGVTGEQFQRIMTTLISRDSVLERVGEITAPVLVLHGSADSEYPIARAESLVAALPNAEPLVTIVNGAHFLSLSHAAEINPHLKEFLAAHAAGK
ncbi:alpha/beta fold hydrolase [Amycolatopsis saalfeldensis]|uniref:Pimeloyl-ACP methyl ester carboxylesterase n=1 Tax=Amycolatopsis saalfeldensis TaxID=394193 RepID=A0A1H8YKZ8_9PSEU|nr:alpha/beta hydrolase [Amycolatopsis saalfeldensis]SEP52712.1 Pimeloyl-ACP methyl ester carboxylesterase [Amycolatopsis saalfeldensis]